MTDTQNKKFLRVLSGEAVSPPPVWLMRQAGRYLPEYRETRAKAKTFLELCYSPEMAVEVTMQPIRRYRFDASILFSDILVIPDAMGQKVSFIPGSGPALRPPLDAPSVGQLVTDKVETHLAPVFETVRGLREKLPKDVTLIGFAGAPWTVATYMIAGAGSPDQAAAKSFAYNHPEAFEDLLNRLVEATSRYLKAQVEAGAEVIQLFDTWAGSLSPSVFEKAVIAPTAQIVDRLRADFPELPIIGFPKGVGANYERFFRETGVTGLSLDTSVDLSWARKTLGERVPLQGNLDPLLLIAGGPALDREVDKLLDQMAGTPYIFNLGHGIQPPTPPEHVTQMLDRIRARPIQ